MKDPKPPDPPARSFPEIAFPDLPRLRLEALLRAHAAVASELSLPAVLDHIVAQARTLVGARFAAIGVIGDDGRLRRFHHAGMVGDDASRIGRTPRSRGLLDVPVTAGGRVFGNLYLADAAAGAFTEEDERLVVALAAIAGAAVHNARLYEDAERRHRWQTAATEVSQELFAGPPDDVWRVVLGHALVASSGRTVAVAVPGGADPAVLTIRHADGEAADQLTGATLALEPADVDTVLRKFEPVLMAATSLAVAQGPPVGVDSVVLAPVLRAGRVEEVLGVIASEDAPLAAADAEQVGRFAGHVAMALELAASRTDRERVRQLDDHERIAADLNDGVVTDLFAAGMTLEALVPFLPATDARRIADAVDAIDRSIKQIRSAVFRSRTNGAGG